MVAYCTKLPTEVWTRCWSQSSPRDLRRLVRVCRYFHDLCQPLLFQCQRFRAPSHHDIGPTNWIGTVQDLHRSTIRVRKLLASIHVSAVRSWDFRGDTEYPSLIDINPNILNIGSVNETYQKLVHLFTSTLCVYQNLRSLHLRSFTVDTELREALPGLARLEELELDSCNIIGRTGPLLALQELKLAWWGWGTTQTVNQPLYIVSPDTLRTLTLGDSRNSGALLAALTEQPHTFHSLTTLSIELSDSILARFLQFLEACPQLTRLEIIKSYLTKHPLGHLAGGAIPRLRSFKGPRLLAAFFVCERPVSIMDLAGGSGFDDESKPAEKDIIRDLANIAHVSSGVQSFSIMAPIRLALTLSAAITTHWPDLRELRLLLKETPPPRASRVIADVDSDEDSDTYSETSDMMGEPVADTCTVELSDNESLGSARFSPGYPPIMLSPDSDAEDAEPIPDVLLPGHMYSSYRHVSPPAPDTQSTQQTDDPDTIQNLVNRISAGSFSLPRSLERLHLTRPQSWMLSPRGRPLSAADHHRVVLALERQLPALRELNFGKSTIWRRHRNTWTQGHTGTKIASLYHSSA
ncbi:hypothetical protein MVEN_01827200 [Mycena venus]|uniref:F-box domain-containing protein n=1 Tax=Mycena venus TaxID=2733690 RepID=A0A8H6XJL2_9AGAR|nr:hypothetical protein MVEN_01827200 [Mycena venus]